jgi:hypothetical protein
MAGHFTALTFPAARRYTTSVSESRPDPVQDPAVLRALLAHVGRTLSTAAPGPAPPAPAAIG